MESKIFLVANLLSAAGALVVAGILSAAALGRWKRGKAFRIMAWLSALGGLLPFVLWPIWTYVNRHSSLEVRVSFDKFAIVVWPSSLGLMALDAPGRAAGSGLVLICMLILMNMGLYGLIGLCVGAVWQKTAKANSVVDGKGQE
ncbi:MAG: hypothetical protein WBX03_00180 [Terriglobales bacterium]|jgi:hypothetical protein